MTTVSSTIQIKPYSLTEMAGIYGVDWRTFKKWLQPFEEEIGPRNGRFYSIPQVRVIFERLSLPCSLVVD